MDLLQFVKVNKSAVKEVVVSERSNIPRVSINSRPPEKISILMDEPLLGVVALDNGVTKTIKGRNVKVYKPLL